MTHIIFYNTGGQKSEKSIIGHGGSRRPDCIRGSTGKGMYLLLCGLRIDKRRLHVIRTDGGRR